MREKIVTGLLAGTVTLAMALPAAAGGIGEPEIEPEVFTTTEAVAAGSLGGAPGLILLGVVAGAVLIAGDSE